MILSQLLNKIPLGVFIRVTCCNVQIFDGTCYHLKCDTAINKAREVYTIEPRLVTSHQHGFTRQSEYLIIEIDP